MAYKIVLTNHAYHLLKKIKNRAVREQITEVIDSLAENPLQLGKPLRGLLSKYRSIRAARQRYRIVYSVDEEKVIVPVIALGIRKGKDRDDIYQVIRSMLKRGDDPSER